MFLVILLLRAIRDCTMIIALLILDLLTIKIFFLRCMGSLSAEHTILMVAMEFLSCPVLLAIRSSYRNDEFPGHFCVTLLMAPSLARLAKSNWWNLYCRMDNESTRFLSHQYVSDDSDTHDCSEIPRLSCDQPSIGSLTGVLYTSPIPVSLWAPM